MGFILKHFVIAHNTSVTHDDKFTSEETAPNRPPHPRQGLKDITLYVVNK